MKLTSCGKLRSPHAGTDAAIQDLRVRHRAFNLDRLKLPTPEWIAALLDPHLCRMPQRFDEQTSEAFAQIMDDVQTACRPIAGERLKPRPAGLIRRAGINI
jgi:hypothetical protein